MAATEIPFPGAVPRQAEAAASESLEASSALAYFKSDPAPESHCTPRPADSVEEDTALWEGRTTDGNLGC